MQEPVNTSDLDGTKTPAEMKPPNFHAIPKFEEGAWRGNFSKLSEQTLSLNALVSGSNRCKYFNKPLSSKVPIGFQKPTDPSEFWWWKLQEPDPPQYVSVGTVTDYRESETQTPPWDPPFKSPPPSPFLEVMAISDLVYGSGLPAGPEEIEQIVIAREKRAWEKMIPPESTDRNQMIKRHNMIAKWKIKEMNDVKAKIHKHFQQKQMNKELALRAKMQQRENRKDQVLQSLYEERRNDTLRKIRYVREDRVKRVQYLDKKRSVLTAKTDFVDIEPLVCTRSEPDISVPHQKCPRKSTAEHFYLETTKGLVDLERWLWEEQKMLMEPEIYGPRRDPHPSRLQRIIEQAEEDISERDKIKRKIKSKPMKILEREKLMLQEEAPLDKQIAQVTVDRANALFIIQKLIRNRALQKEVLEICHKYEDLILELHNTFPPTHEGEVVLAEERKKDAVLFLEEKADDNEEKIRDETLARFEGSVLSAELQMLGTSVNRSGCLEDIEIFIWRAKDERRRLEAAEGGRRQQEVYRQKILDGLFTEIHSTD